MVDLLVRYLWAKSLVVCGLAALYASLLMLDCAAVCAAAAVSTAMIARFVEGLRRW